MLTIEPTRILTDTTPTLVAWVCPNNEFRLNGDWIIERGECKTLAEALLHFAAHGTFCPEPVRPIEWLEPIKGLLWASGLWWIRRANDNQYHAWYMTSYMKSYDSCADAKSYAESQIRKGTP